VAATAFAHHQDKKDEDKHDEAHKAEPEHEPA